MNTTRPTAHLAADPNPITTPDRFTLGATTLRWESAGAETVEVRVDAPDGPLLSRGSGSGSVKTGEWVSDGMTFFLQDVSGGAPLTTENTIATTRVRLKSSGTPCGIILMYHRVTEICPDPWSIAVTPSHFAEQMAALREIAAPCGLRQLALAAQGEVEVSPSSVAITFDDGYADNLYQAKPWLERYEIPATVFVTADYVGGKRDFWWDAIDCVLVSESLPPTLDLAIDGREYRWDIEVPEAPAESLSARLRGWRASPEGEGPSGRRPRAKLYRDLHRLLKPAPEEERLAVVDRLLSWAGMESSGRENYRQLTAEETRAMARDGLIEIGSHTLTHPDLRSLPPRSQQTEIERSKASLTEMLDLPVRNFAYPYGACSAETVDLVRAAGYESACVASFGTVTSRSDRFQLPRMMVEDWDGDEFRRRLIDWLQ
jgi:peptidoglycan/xylan/chitin deacetylase (PgdA/CDA1 family)